MPRELRVAFSAPDWVVLDTRGVTVRAEDGGFNLVPGRAIRTPFHQGADCLLMPAPDTARQGELSGGRRVRILVTREGERTEFFGVLSLCGLAPGVQDVDYERYVVEIPEEKLEEVADNGSAVVYAPYVEEAPGVFLNVFSWILWISSGPIEPLTPGSPRGIGLSEYIERFRTEAELAQACDMGDQSACADHLAAIRWLEENGCALRRLDANDIYGSGEC